MPFRQGTGPETVLEDDLAFVAELELRQEQELGQQELRQELAADAFGRSAAADTRAPAR